MLMPNVIMLSVFSAECHYQVHYAKCCYAKCRYDECYGPIVNGELFTIWLLRSSS